MSKVNDFLLYNVSLGSRDNVIPAAALVIVGGAFLLIPLIGYLLSNGCNFVTIGLGVLFCSFVIYCNLLISGKLLPTTLDLQLSAKSKEPK